MCVAREQRIQRLATLPGLDSKEIALLAVRVLGVPLGFRVVRGGRRRFAHLGYASISSRVLP